MLRKILRGADDKGRPRVELGIGVVLIVLTLVRVAVNGERLEAGHVVTLLIGLGIAWQAYRKMSPS